MSAKKPATYSDAGVDIDAGNELIERIKPLVESTRRDGVLGGIGGFGGLFELAGGRYQQPVLVAGTDGVGTKLKLAIELNLHNTVGIDLVAMCVHDVVVQGAEPLFFLDYYGCARLDTTVAASVIEGIAEGCRQAGAALLGGETAELPGMYQEPDYDLAGFCVGIAEKDALVDSSMISVGDRLVGLASSGPHSNGYSLIRKLLADSGKSAASSWNGGTLGQQLLVPTRIYVRAILKLLDACPVHGIAHITGGGLLDNLARILPQSVDVHLEPTAWHRPRIFDWLQDQGRIEPREMYRTFNCGIGMVVIVPERAVDEAVALLTDEGESASIIGQVVTGSGQVHIPS
jgi:phosphoribosylformylglycinamidine cyclo-ligase